MTLDLSAFVTALSRHWHGIATALYTIVGDHYHERTNTPLSRTLR